jgi:hypothetical protein
MLFPMRPSSLWRIEKTTIDGVKGKRVRGTEVDCSRRWSLRAMRVGRLDWSGAKAEVLAKEGVIY